MFGRRKNPDSIKYKREMAQKIIGREGALALRDDELIVFASQDILFRTDVATLNASELLSKDGVIISGPDNAHGGVERTIIVYYVYYR